MERLPRLRRQTEAEGRRLLRLLQLRLCSLPAHSEGRTQLLFGRIERPANYFAKAR
ncbi:hypothetical protein MTBLM1_10474 [Rhodospirillaceae bacterium LM-1]|nr:hypothetical protein MTBLM1_10474 [Rhodospirillaceae bacterium LM-1]